MGRGRKPRTAGPSRIARAIAQYQQEAMKAVRHMSDEAAARQQQRVSSASQRMGARGRLS